MPFKCTYSMLPHLPRMHSIQGIFWSPCHYQLVLLFANGRGLELPNIENSWKAPLWWPPKRHQRIHLSIFVEMTCRCFLSSKKTSIRPYMQSPYPNAHVQFFWSTSSSNFEWLCSWGIQKLIRQKAERWPMKFQIEPMGLTQRAPRGSYRLIKQNEKPA